MKLKCKKCDKEVEPEIRRKILHHTAYCPDCGSYIKHVKQSKDKGVKITTEDGEEREDNGRELPEFTFGQYAGLPIYEFDSESHLSYLEWARRESGVWLRLSRITRNAIKEKLKEHQGCSVDQ